MNVPQKLSTCTACGACVEVCPTPTILDQADGAPEVVAAGVLDILRDREGSLLAEAWARACCGTGNCLSVCEYGINPRFMLTMARRTLSRRNDLFERRDAGKAAFKSMSRGVNVISLTANATRSYGTSKPQLPLGPQFCARRDFLYWMQHA